MMRNNQVDQWSQSWRGDGTAASGKTTAIWKILENNFLFFFLEESKFRGRPASSDGATMARSEAANQTLVVPGFEMRIGRQETGQPVLD